MDTTKSGFGATRGVPATAALLLALLPAAAWAQAPSPYAGEETRDIKSLSAEEQRALEAGEGMGFARAAELNGYPGPRHVLDMADELSLSAEQRSRIQGSFDAMHEAALREGHDLIEAERALDALFASGTASPETLGTAVERAAAARGRVRRAHLAAHVQTRSILTPQQVHAYMRLRGYASGDHQGPHH